MKKITGLLIVIVAALSFVSCEPIEDRQEMKGATTMDKINQLVSVTPEIRDGLRSNYLILKSDGLDALSSWDYGVGTYVGTNGRVQVVVPGDQTIVFTALNGDGTKLQKAFTITVDSCYDVAPQWEYLCGTGSKVWTWDDSLGEAAYGMGDAGDNSADWWAPGLTGKPEGIGATMTFSVKGAALTKDLTDGTTQAGAFSFDMTKTHANYKRSQGELTTSIPVLMGQTTGGDTGFGSGGKDVKVYEILTLDGDQLVLSWLESSANPDTDGWGQATLWFFKVK